uniref:Fucoxanthin chlorophyll a/c-binding protein Lhcf6 n=1 Tax=Chaetoceros neogracilis TaxID=240364 RepID=UPI00148AE2CA|nr:Chain 9, Fucoxanthin chlorophyll a/c-binding protein Lhcf6 [Chaetoceros gracilis]
LLLPYSPYLKSSLTHFDISSHSQPPLFSTNPHSSAFAPSSQTNVRSTSSLQAWKDENIIGITAPMGFFDPLGLSSGKSDEVMNLYREAELKHGRVAMAACLGWYITAAGVHPAFNSALSSDPLEAAKQLPTVGWLQFVLGCGAIEWLAQQIKARPGYQPGDILGAAYWVDNSDEGWVDYQNKEINNGRLAMVAFMGIFVQDLYFGNYGDQIFRN